MPWNTDGSFTRLYSWNADASAGLDIASDRMDADTNDIVQGLERGLNLDGYNSPSTNINMASWRFTNVGAGVGPTDFARLDQVVQNSGGASLTGGLTVDNLTVTGPGYALTLTNVAGSIKVAGGVVAGTACAMPSLALSGTGYALTIPNGGINSAGGILGPFMELTGAGAGVLSMPNGGIDCLGYSYLQGGLRVVGGLTVDDTVDTAAMTVGGGLTVADTNNTGNMTVGGVLSLTGGGYALSVYPGAININGGIATAGGITAASLDLTGAGYALSVNPGSITVGGGISVSGGINVSGNLSVGGNLGVSGNLGVTGTGVINGVLTLEAGGYALNIPGGGFISAGACQVSNNMVITGNLQVGTINGGPPLRAASAAELEALIEVISGLPDGPILIEKSGAFTLTARAA